MRKPGDPTAPRALYSADGTRWDQNEGNGPVTKIVIGTPPKPGDEAKLVTLAESVSSDLQRMLVGEQQAQKGGKPEQALAGPTETTKSPDASTITHLHLWQVKGLKSLPKLPTGLKTLDVRGCAEVESLPELPIGLDVLDIGQCTGLKRVPAPPPKLERFFFNDCAALEELDLRLFLRELAHAPVVEADLSRTALTTLDEVPRKMLRKLVLAGCAKLASVAGLEDFPALEHLNLSDCTALEMLPELPPRLRYLLLYGAEKLVDFMGQDIGPYDRGKENENVAHAFLSRRKFGRELAVMPHAKLLLMGDGRVGKSTLAKRLQYEETQSPETRPDKNEPFTHKVRFWRWETGLALPRNEMAALKERAAAANVTLPKTKNGLLDGAVRLWDFGGQELYHSTHRGRRISAPAFRRTVRSWIGVSACAGWRTPPMISRAGWMQCSWREARSWSSSSRRSRTSFLLTGARSRICAAR